MDDDKMLEELLDAWAAARADEAEARRRLSRFVESTSGTWPDVAMLEGLAAARSTSDVLEALNSVQVNEVLMDDSHDGEDQGDDEL